MKKLKKHYHWRNEIKIVDDYKIKTYINWMIDDLEIIYVIQITNLKNNYTASYQYYSLRFARRRLYKLIKEIRSMR